MRWNKGRVISRSAMARSRTVPTDARPDAVAKFKHFSNVVR